MPRKPNGETVELTPLVLSKLPPGRHVDQDVTGLMLQVPDPSKPLKDGKARTKRTWVLRVMYGGRRRDIGLGGYPAVGLADARDRARKMRTAIFEGRDPLAEKQLARSAIQAAAAGAVTFKRAAEEYIKKNASTWKNPKHRSQWESTLETYVYPHMGKVLVADIKAVHVLAVLEQEQEVKGPPKTTMEFWHAKNETATRVRQRIETVLDYATTRGYREGDNPARWRGFLEHSLAAPGKVAQVENQPALPVDLMYPFMQRLATVEGQGARALHFCILTAVRSGNVREAVWSEIDLDGAVWTIPKDKMKGQKDQAREHRVPLAAAALELLRQQGKGKPDALVFPGTKGALSDATLSAAIKRLNKADNRPWIDPNSGREVVPHGFRTSFRSWAASRTAYPREVVEMAMAHVIENKAEAAYQRDDMLDRRRPLMDAWADFIATPPATGATVTSIGAKRTRRA